MVNAARANKYVILKRSVNHLDMSTFWDEGNDTRFYAYCTCHL